MVSAITTLLAAVFGLLVYFMVPVASITAPVDIRQRVGSAYLSMGTRCLKQFTFVRRVLSGYDILPISVDDEQKLLEVTLTSSTLSEDTTYRFDDPDNRILRLFNRPVALAFEKVPAAVDAELAEWGYWTREKRTDDGLWRGSMDEPNSLRADPYVPADDGLRLVDPVDAFDLVSNDVDPENVKTAEKITKKRYEKYGSGPSLRQTARVMLGFAVGAGMVVAVRYAEKNIIDGGGGGGVDAPVVGNETLSWVDPSPDLLLDMVVALV